MYRSQKREQERAKMKSKNDGAGGIYSIPGRPLFVIALESGLEEIGDDDLWRTWKIA